MSCWHTEVRKVNYEDSLKRLLLFIINFIFFHVLKTISLHLRLQGKRHSLQEYYIGHCPLTHYMYTVFWNLTLLLSSGNCNIKFILLGPLHQINLCPWKIGATSRRNNEKCTRTHSLTIILVLSKPVSCDILQADVFDNTQTWKDGKDWRTMPLSAASHTTSSESTVEASLATFSKLHNINNSINHKYFNVCHINLSTSRLIFTLRKT